MSGGGPPRGALAGAIRYRMYSRTMRCVVALLACLQIVQGFQTSCTKRRSSVASLYAVDPSIVADSVSSAGAHMQGIIIAATGDLGQSTSAALKEFNVNIPEASQMLTTTLRSSAAGTGGVMNPSTKLPLDLGLTPQQVESSLSPFFQSILSEPKYWGSIIIAVIISDILQNSAAVQKKNRAFTNEYSELEDKLVFTENAFEAVKALQGDAVELSKQLEDARAEVAAYKLKEEYNSKTLTSPEKAEVPVPATLAKESTSSPGGRVARDMEIERLRKELAEEKKKRAKYCRLWRCW